MTVDPGFGGQEFIKPMLKKVREIAEMIAAHRSKAYLEVDGGINERNAAELVRAGATVLVAGHSVYARRNVSGAIRSLRKAAMA